MGRRINPAIEKMVEAIIKAEGGYVNDPADRGGATNWGVTIAVYSKWIGRKATIQEMKYMPRSVAEEIFINNYYYKPRIDMIQDDLEHKVFDMSVNHGPSRGNKLLQSSLRALGENISVDGKIGLQTAKASENAVAKHGVAKVVNTMVAKRNAFYKRIVARNPSQNRFIKGWLNRSNKFLMDE